MVPSPSIRRAPCTECRVDFSQDRTHCPHCGRPQIFPNVVCALQSVERQELDRRYTVAIQQADREGRRAQVDAFERACQNSQAVLCCKLEKLLPVAKGERDLFAKFYDLLSLRFIHEPRPGEPDWNRLRPITEIALLGSERNHKDLHYGALTLDGHGLPHYGECEVVLRDEMISHRTSVFEENSAMYVHRFGHVIPAGRRSDWSTRGRLCVAKLASRISAPTSLSQFPGILLKSAPSALDDQLVELQIFGELTFHSFQRVRLRRAAAPKPSASVRPRKKRGYAEEKVLRDYCRGTLTNGAPVEFEVL